MRKGPAPWVRAATIRTGLKALGQCAFAGLFFVLSGCSTPSKQSPSPQTTTFWQPDDQWWQGASRSAMALRRPDGRLVTLPKSSLETLAETRTRLLSSMAIEVDIVFAELSYANAYAVIVDDRVKVILSLSLLARFEGDREALQFILAHEFSHAWLGHLKDNQRAQREATFQQGGYLAGTLANFFIPFSGALVSQAVLGVGRERSRDEERQADEAALTWLENQGLPLCGALRLTQKLRPVHGAQSLGFLSTHPSLDEREAYFSERAAAVGEDCASGKI